MARTPGTTRVLAVAYDKREAEVLSRLYEYELPHCGGNQRRAVANVNQAMTRQRQNRSGVFHLSVDLLNDLQDAGLPALRALDALEWSWEGLQEVKRRFTPPPSQDDEIVIHVRAVEWIISALHGVWREVLLRSPVTLLRTVIRCAWRYRWKLQEEFRQALDLAAAFVDLGCDESELATLFRTLAGESLVGLGIGISSGVIAKDEALAIARHAKEIVRLDVGAQQSILSALISFRGRVRPDRFLRTVESIGVDSATAFHALTSDSGVAMRADEARQHLTLSLPQYLGAFEALRALRALDFDAYVELTEHWSLDVLQVIYVAYPNAVLLRRLIGVGQASMVERAARAGIPLPALSRFGESLLRYLKPRPDAEWLDAVQAFDQFSGVAVDADVYLALPATLRDHRAVRELVERVGVVVLRDRPLLDLVIVVAGAGYAVDVELLREFQRIGTWPSPRGMQLVYGLAQRFRSTGVPSDVALRRAAESHDRLSPRKCSRAIRDRGYFRYAVLGEQRAAAAAEPTSVGSDRELAAPTPSGIKRVRRPSGPVVAEVAVPPAGVVPLTDLRTLHEQFDLQGLVPLGTDSKHVAAVILHGFCDLGIGIPRAGRHYIVEQNARGRIRRRCDISERSISDAWRWLSSIKIIVGPRRRGGDWAYALDLRDDHENPNARELSHRIRVFLQRFQEQTRR